MALLVLLFLDLATIPPPAVHGAVGEDVAVYRQALADLKVRWDHTLAETKTSQRCAQLGAGASDVRKDTLADYLERNRLRLSNEVLSQLISGVIDRQPVGVAFSSVGWSHDANQAWLQVDVDDGMTSKHDTHCVLYRRVGARFKLAREVRAPR
jgi:hypothetical protein